MQLFAGIQQELFALVSDQVHRLMTIPDGGIFLPGLQPNKQIRVFLSPILLGP